eukprot:COSAG03_NODE_5340_length_1271_cov_3.134812_2_plen_180_part_00
MNSQMPQPLAVPVRRHEAARQACLALSSTSSRLTSAQECPRHHHEPSSSLLIPREHVSAGAESWPDAAPFRRIIPRLVAMLHHCSKMPVRQTFLHQRSRLPATPPAVRTAKLRLPAGHTRDRHSTCALLDNVLTRAVACAHRHVVPGQLELSLSHMWERSYAASHWLCHLTDSRRIPHR